MTMFNSLPAYDFVFMHVCRAIQFFVQVLPGIHAAGRVKIHWLLIGFALKKPPPHNWGGKPEITKSAVFFTKSKARAVRFF